MNPIPRRELAGVSALQRRPGKRKGTPAVTADAAFKKWRRFIGELAFMRRVMKDRAPG